MFETRATIDPATHVLSPTKVGRSWLTSAGRSPSTPAASDSVRRALMMDRFSSESLTPSR